jgi:hypothetical protein
MQPAALHKGCPPVWFKTLTTVGYAFIFCAVHLYIMAIYTIDNTYLADDWDAKPLWRKFWWGGAVYKLRIQFDP